jgi:ABC-2 type transport system permease protein
MAAVLDILPAFATHFVSFSQVIIYRGGGFSAVWLHFLMVSAIGLGFFVYSLALFRKSIAVTK